MSSLLRPKKKLECNSVRQFNEYYLLENQTLSNVRFRFVAGKVKVNFFRCHNDKNTAAMGFLVYELNCRGN
jgi:hypothetical protein